MSMGYPAAQGYTGSPANPKPPRKKLDWEKLLMGAKLGGMGLSAFSDWMAADAQAEGYEQEAYSAGLAAEEVRKRAKYESWRMDLAKNRTLGSMRSAYGAAGIEMEGTPIDVLAETAKAFTIDNIMMRRAAGIEANQHRADAHNYRRAARTARKKGLLDAIGEFLP